MAAKPKAKARRKRRGPSPQKLAADRRKRRALADVALERLGERYDHPQWAGPRLDAVSELVLTILSQNTADVNSFRAFTALRARYTSWDEVLQAPRDELEDVIRPGGLAPTKSGRIQHVLAEVHDATGGSWDLSFLGEPAARGGARLAGVAARHRPQDGLDHPAIRLRASRGAGRYPRPPCRDQDGYAASAHPVGSSP